MEDNTHIFISILYMPYVSFVLVVVLLDFLSFSVLIGSWGPEAHSWKSDSGPAALSSGGESERACV